MRGSKSIAVGLVLAALVCGIALAGDALVTRLITSSQYTESGRIARVLARGKSDEIPIFGSSQACADYNPAVLGVEYFNYCLKGASQTYVNLMLALEAKNPSKSLVLVNVRQGPYPDQDHRFKFVPFARQNPSIRSTLEETKQWRWYYDVPGIRYFGLYDRYIANLVDIAEKGELVPGIGSEDRRFTRGYTSDFTAEIAPAAFRKMVDARRNIPFEYGLSSEHYRQLISIFRSRPDRPFVVVLAPLHPSFINRYKGLSSFLKQAADLDALPNVAVLDYTRAQFPDEQFYDSGHLNYLGARIFSTNLSKRVAKLREQWIGERRI